MKPIVERKSTKMASKKFNKQTAHLRRRREFLERINRESGLLDGLRRTLGRHPNPGGPIVFESDGKTLIPEDPETVVASWIEAGKEAGIDPVFLHAIEKTGFVLSEENMYLFSEDDWKEWNDAIEEGRRIHGHESTRGR